MQIVQSGVPFSSNYTAYDQASDLNVAFSIYDVTDGDVTFIEQVAAEYTGFGSYATAYTIDDDDKDYVIVGVVYTDSGFTIVDTDRAPGTECYKTSSASVSSLVFDYTSFEQLDSLFIQATAYDMTTGSPVLDSTVILDYIAFGVYFGIFDGTPSKTYDVVSVVYTDNTYTVVDTDLSPSCENLNCVTFSSVTTNVMQRAVLIDQPTKSTLVRSTMLTITQGDSVTFEMTATNGNNVPFDLTGAVFTTYVRGPNGSAVVSFPNSQHTANPNQITNRGKFSLYLSQTNTETIAVGNNREIITEVVQGGSTVYFHGFNILNVLPNVPLQ